VAKGTLTLTGPADNIAEAGTGVTVQAQVTNYGEGPFPFKVEGEIDGVSLDFGPERWLESGQTWYFEAYHEMPLNDALVTVRSYYGSGVGEWYLDNTRTLTIYLPAPPEEGGFQNLAILDYSKV